MSKRLRARLSAQSIKTLPFHRYTYDFEFHVGERTYSCPSFIADFLSPKIASLHASDATVNYYVVHAIDSSEAFQSFLALGFGEELLIDTVSFPFFSELCEELEISEIAAQLSEYLETEDELTIENVYDRFILRKRFQLNVSAETNFLALNFHKLPDAILSELNLPDLTAILTNDLLKLRNEDYLFDFIAKRTHSDPEFFVLFGTVHFELLSLDCIQSFVQLSESCLDMITLSVWSRICDRLLLSISERRRDESRYVETVSHPFVSAAPLDGMISYLSKKCGGNVHDHHAVNVSANSLQRDFAGKNAVDLLVDSYFLSLNAPDSWICYDFRSMRIRPTHYSIRSRHDAGPGSAHPKTWVIEGSVDGEAWMELDRREENSELDGRNLIKTFAISKVETIRLIRLRQIGKNHYDNDHLMFAAWELFGGLTEDLND